ncbi:MAG: glycosyltransferase family 2 protein, partial [Saprospiraceae bacterium]|nr:glycosyltransferase family 2 protein [Saprospiraceae bacterium]
MSKPLVDVIIPAYNEEESIGSVLRDIPEAQVREVIVCNNNSSDRTEEVARKAGATVILQKRKGYGAACLKGLEYLAKKEKPPEIVVFLDGDYSDHPE